MQLGQDLNPIPILWGAEGGGGKSSPVVLIKESNQCFNLQLLVLSGMSQSQQIIATISFYRAD